MHKFITEISYPLSFPHILKKTHIIILDKNTSSIFLLYLLNMEKGPSNIKVLNFGIIFLSILNHCSLLRIKYKN